MRRYPQTPEIFFMPNPKRRRRTHRIELPFSEYEDLRMRLGIVRSAEAGRYPVVQVTDASVAAEVLEPISREPQEVMVVLCLDVGNRVQGIVEVGRGSLSRQVVDPAVIFQAAILASSAAIIVAHNHPSGYPEPSKEDMMASKGLSEAGKILGIKLLDFIIIGANHEYVSFADRGIL